MVKQKAQHAVHPVATYRVGILDHKQHKVSVGMVCTQVARVAVGELCGQDFDHRCAKVQRHLHRRIFRAGIDDHDFDVPDRLLRAQLAQHQRKLHAGIEGWDNHRNLGVNGRSAARQVWVQTEIP